VIAEHPHVSFAGMEEYFVDAKNDFAEKLEGL